MMGLTALYCDDCMSSQPPLTIWRPLLIRDDLEMLIKSDVLAGPGEAAE